MAGKKRLFSEIMGPPENPNDTKHEKEIIFEDAKKNLLESFNKSQAAVVDPVSDHMKVYLRVRPFSVEELSRDEDQKCLDIESEQSVVAYAPKDSHTYKNYTHGLGKTNYKFTFSRIFGQETSQKEFFDETMLGLARDFIDGQNCLVFTYGVTSSGKTYTIQGKPHDAGLLPRALDVLFNSISGKQWPGMALKPRMFTDVKLLSPEEEEKERKIKEKTLKMSSDDDTDVMTLLGEDASDISQGNTTTASEGSNVSAMGHHKDSVDGDLFAELENRVREEAAISVEDQGQIKFSIWVSFAEIYNEQIFDLLEPLPKKKNARRPVLKLSEDKNGSPYIKGLKEINVTSADEAYRLLTIGQKNLRTACTKLNHSSSRSHCIFNIKILRVVDTKQPHVARVSMLSLCDLAGSERQSKTQSGGERLKEAGNINTSLMTLGRCIEFLRYNQSHKDNPRMVPFRDSKLTRLFQNFFSGRGKAAMIVNVNQLATMFDETLNVFKFSAIAKQVVVVQKPEPKPKMPRLHPKRDVAAGMRPSIQWASPSTISKYSSEMAELSEEQDTDLDVSNSEIDELLTLVEHLQQELQAERSNKIKFEAKIRNEVCTEMMSQLVQIETDYSERIREKEIEADELVEQRLKILMANQPPSKRPRQDKMTDDEDEWVSSITLHAEQVKVKERDAEIKKLRSEMSKLKSDLVKSSKAQEALTKEKTACDFALADRTRTIQELKEDKTKVVSQLHTSQNELDIAKETISALQKQILQTKRQSVEYSLQKDLDVAKGTIEELQDQLKKALASGSDLGSSDLLQTLSQQLQAAKELQKKQEHEIGELNEMLSEAGETFQQKEEEITKLKAALADDEEKILQQADAIEKLQTALQESKIAVEDNEVRLQKKNERIATLVEEKKQIQGENDELVKKVEELQEELDSDNKESETKTDSSEVNKDHEIEKLKARLQREEDDALKRDQALIHGYNAEIDSYKVQVSDLKSKLREARGLSPHRSPRKTPKKTPQKGADDELFKNHLLKQIRDFQEELDKNSSVVFDLKQSLTIAQESALDLEKKLEVESSRHVETKIALSETETKLKKAVQEKENSEFEFKELEMELRSRVEKADVKLKEKEDILSALEVSHTELKCNHESLLAEQEKLSAERDNVMEVIAAKDKMIIDHVEVKESLKERVDQLENECEKMDQTTEELRVVNTELKQMLSSSTDQHEKLLLQKLDAKEKDAKERISELQEKLNEVLSKNKEEGKRFEALEASKEKEIESVKEEFMQLMTQKDAELQVKVDKIGELAAEVESLRRETDKNTKNCENVEDIINNLRKELEKSALESQDWKKKCEMSEEKIVKLENQLKDQGVKNEELAVSLDEIRNKEKEKDLHLEEVQADLKETQKKLGEQTQTITANEEHVQAVTQQLEQVNAKLKEKTSLIEERSESLNKMKEEISTLEGKLQAKEELSKQNLKNLKNKLSEVQTDLTTKEHELHQVRSTYTEMQEQLTSSDAKLSQLSEASLEIAELKSALHMEKTLHLKYKEDLKTALEEKEEVDSALKKFEEDIKQVTKEKEALAESLDKYSNDLKESRRSRQEAETALKQSKDALKVSESQKSNSSSEMKEAQDAKEEAESALKQCQDNLKQCQNDLKEVKVKISDAESEKNAKTEELETLKDRLQAETEICNELKNNINDLEDKLKLALEEKQSASKDRLSKSNSKSSLEEQLDSAKIREESIKAELTSTKEKAENLEREVARLVRLAGSQSVSVSDIRKDNSSSNDLDIERRRNDELQKILESYKMEDDHGPGSARRVRKEKIEAECALVNANYEIKKLKRQFERSQGSTIVMSPTKTTDRDLVRRLEDTERKLEALEKKHRQTVDELTESRSKVVTLEKEVKDLRCELAEKKQENLSLSINVEKASKERTSSSSTASTDSFVHDELQRSQERERNLRQQLQQASESMKENIDRISELEEQLTTVQHSLMEKEDQLSALKSEKDKMVREQTSASDLKQEVTQLRADLERKSDKLETRSQSIKDLKRSQEGERERFEVALRDAKANEHLIEQLKVAITEQEETMAAQDKVLNNKDQEIKTISEELEKMTDKYRHMLDQRGDSSRELRDVMKSLTKAEVERDEMKREVDKLTAERNQKDTIIRENNHELKDLERTLAEKRQEIVDLKSSVDREVSKIVDEKKSETNSLVDDLKTKIRDRERDLRKVEKEIGHYEEMLKDMRQKVATKDQEMEDWREHRDKLVGSLEALMKNQAAEIKELKQHRENVHIKEEVSCQMEEKEAQIQLLQEKVNNMEHMLSSQIKPPATPSGRGSARKRSTIHANPDLDIIKKQLDQERDDKLELQKQLKILQRANSQIVADLKSSNNSLQVQVAVLQGVPPPPKPPRMDPTFINDDDPAQGHQEMDATPPVAAKAIKRSGRKRAQPAEDGANEAPDQTPKSRRGRGRPAQVKKEIEVVDENLEPIVEDEENTRPSRRAKKAAKGKIGDIVTAIAQSPVTRSAKKFVGNMVDDGQTAAIKQEPEPETKRGRRGKKTLYKEEVSAPFECAPFVPPASSKVDVHNIVTKKLRGRRAANSTDV